MDELAARVDSHIRRHDLIPPGGDVTCLVSGGADSTCLWHLLGELGYRVSAVHVAHGLRGSESEEDAARRVFRLIEALEDLDDVQDVYANFDVSDEVLAAVG